MLVYDSGEWTVGKNKVTVDLGEIHQVEVKVSCLQDVQMLGLRQAKGKTIKLEKVPLKVGREFTERMKLKGFHAIELVGKKNVNYGFRITEIPRQDGEPLNNDNPPEVPMPGADNLVAQFHNMMRENARQNSLLLEPEDLPFGEKYVVDDDDHEFEEDIFQRLQEESQKAEEERQKEEPLSSSQQHPERSNETNDDSQSEQNGESVPGGQPRAARDDASGTLAAE